MYDICLISGEKKRVHSLANFDYKYHCIDGPAIIEYYTDLDKIYQECVSISSERYFINNEIHRINGPAIIEYYKNGNKKFEQWYFKNKKHRIDGPANIWYDLDGEIQSVDYYFEDYNFFSLQEIEDKILQSKEKYPSEYERILKQRSLTLFD